MSSSSNPIIRLISQLLNAFCGGSGQNNNQHQNQNQYQNQGQAQNLQQPYQQYPAQQQPYYPPHSQQQPYQPQQAQQHPQQPHQNWSQVAGGQYPPHNQNHAQNQQQNAQHQNHDVQYQKGHAPSKPSYQIPHGGIIGPHHPSNHNQDQINATNEKYTRLRSQARQEGDEAHKCFAMSQEAYQSGDGARAHDLSLQGKQHQKRQDDLDDEASAWIFTENNQSSPPATVDLHGLYVKEAIERTESAIASGQASGQEELRVIVGKGIHSQGGVAKIRPAVEGLMQKYNLSAHLDPHNTGVLIVDLNGNESGPRTRHAGGLVDQMERNQEGCVVM